ncbi:LLM class flavin-dependent oxidoreductase [Streptosporangium sp. NPDC000396]|uniref:LLM class flavin-dependent oxidoreductase n=1 Tax=Streptosporangium sp. NPDC000396 TaxID=3366185 RepID=UPI0036B968C3
MRLGVMFDRDLPPESLIPFCRHLDATEVDDLWVVEDLGWTGSISSAATALATTGRLRVGIGITPAPLRNPALLAMELGNLARMHPHRLAAGIGHGVQDWMRQVGAAAPSPLALLEETILAVRALLRGETVTSQGRAVRLDGVRLVHPPAVPPPVLAGVVRPRSLELSGRVAQGTILPEGFGPERVREARKLTGQDDHELVVFTYLYVHDDPGHVRAAVLPAATEQAGFLGVDPDDVPMAAGSPDTVAAHIRSLWEAGVDTVVLRPIGDEPLTHVDRALAALRNG